jgi:hypothetical protein
MNSYQKSWLNDFETSINKEWVGFQKPMSLKLSADKKSRVYISANLKFNKKQVNNSKTPQGSLYYKILVNGKCVNEYHVSNPLYQKTSTGVSLHASTYVFPGNTTVEVQYKVSKNGSWALLNNLGQRELNILSVPLD